MLITSSMFGKQLFQMLHHSCFSLLLTYLCDYYKIMMLDSCPEVSHEKAHWCPPDFVLMLLDPADCIWIFHIFFWDQHTRHIRLCCICCSYVSYAKYSHYKFIFSTHTRRLCECFTCQIHSHSCHVSDTVFPLLYWAQSTEWQDLKSNVSS